MVMYQTSMAKWGFETGLPDHNSVIISHGINYILLFYFNNLTLFLWVYYLQLENSSGQECSSIGKLCSWSWHSASIVNLPGKEIILYPLSVIIFIAQKLLLKTFPKSFPPSLCLNVYFDQTLSWNPTHAFLKTEMDTSITISAVFPFGYLKHAMTLYDSAPCLDVFSPIKKDHCTCNIHIHFI